MAPERDLMTRLAVLAHHSFEGGRAAERGDLTEAVRHNRAALAATWGIVGTVQTAAMTLPAEISERLEGFWLHPELLGNAGAVDDTQRHGT